MSSSYSCPPSPTSAHYWFIDKFGLGQCKYCYEVRSFTTEFHMSKDYASANAKARAIHSSLVWRERQKKKQINADLDYALSEALRETTE